MNDKEYLDSVSPCHRAICDLNIGESMEGADLIDCYGYRAFELALLLGRVGFFNWKELRWTPPVIKVVVRGEHTLQRLSPSRFLRIMGVSYAPVVRFGSLTHWLAAMKEAPLLLKSGLLGSEVLEYGEHYGQLWTRGTVADVTVVWLGEVGYGLIANKMIKKGTIVGAYTGLLRRIRRSCPVLNDYCVHYPTRYCSTHYYVIDARFYGNELRYINHSDTPNLRGVWAYNRGLLHLLFVARRDIPRTTQLTVDYGADFWQSRSAPI